MAISILMNMREYKIWATNIHTAHHKILNDLALLNVYDCIRCLTFYLHFGVGSHK